MKIIDHDLGNGQYGNTYHTGPCFGVGWQPYKISKDGTEAYVKVLQGMVAQRLHWLEELKAGPEKIYDEIRRRMIPNDGTPKPEGYTRSEFWESVRLAISRAEQEIRGLREEIAEVEKKIQEWKPQPLPGRAARVAARWAELNLQPGTWDSVNESQMDTKDKERLWYIHRLTYDKIGNPVRSLSELLSEYETYWVVDVDGDKLADAFIAYKRTSAGKKIGLVGSDGTQVAKRATVRQTMTLLRQSGWYSELSHKPAEIAESSGVPKVMDEATVRAVLKKDIEWLGDGKYRRNITGIGPVVKSMFGIPSVHVASAQKKSSEDLYTTKDGKPITFKVHERSPYPGDLPPEKNKGFVIHVVEAYVDGKEVGYLKITYIPKAYSKYLIGTAISESLDFQKFKQWNLDKPHVDYIRVDNVWKRQGIATALYNYGAKWLAQVHHLPLYASTLQQPEAAKAWDAMEAKGFPVKHQKVVPDRSKEKIDRRRLDYRAAVRVAAKYKDKKTVKTPKGKEMVVYEYSDRQIANRDREKAEQVEKLRHSIGDLRKQIQKDLKSDDEKTKAVALAIGLLDATFERVGNSTSAEEGHVGVTGWQKKHLTFGDGKVTIRYTGKSGVKHEKVVDTPASVKALKEAVKDKGPEDEVVDASAEDVNSYLEKFGISAKDLRGYHANDELKKNLKAVRSKGGKLPEDKKEREEQLKAEFKKALKETAEAVGHTEKICEQSYIVAAIPEAFLKDGTVVEKLTKKATRPIPLDRTELTHVVDQILAGLARISRDDPDAPLSEIHKDPLLAVTATLTNVFGVPTKATVYVIAKSSDSHEWVTGGATGRHKVTKDPVVILQLNGKYPRGSFGNHLRSKLQEVLAHELTHVLDKSPNQSGPVQGHIPTSGELDPKVYFNLPQEVRAYMREMYEAIVPSVRKIMESPLAKEWGLAGTMTRMLRNEEIWKDLEKHLTPANRQKMLKGILTALQDDQDKHSKTASGNLAEDLERRVLKLISDYEAVLTKSDPDNPKDWPALTALGNAFEEWFNSVFRVATSTTPPGGKAIKDQVARFMWAAKSAAYQDRSTNRIKKEYQELKPLIPALIAKFSDEGGNEVLMELKTSIALYKNLRGVPTASFKKMVATLDAIFNSLKGWRRKALDGGFTVALAGPDQFRGTAKGRYNAAGDTMFVRATPDVMKRSGGQYASPEYILIHELGHRYEHKHPVSIDFDTTGIGDWHTTRYSWAESGFGHSEAFAELFALGHFGITNYGATQFGDKLEKFDKVMMTGKIQ